LIEIHGVADSIAIYLHILQERLTCIPDGFQEGALQTTGKDSRSICTDCQTCCNVVQPNLSDSGLGGHLCAGSRCSGRFWASSERITECGRSGRCRVSVGGYSES
jgi:hypothetical protein